MPLITPNLWFDNNAVEAAEFYVSLFPNSRVTHTSYYPESAPGPTGGVMSVQFELDGQEFVAINGGPQFTFNESISLQINCKDQTEIDRIWTALSAVPEAEICGWLKDRYGLSWQIASTDLNEMMSGTAAQVDAVFKELMQMGKPNLQLLRAAFEAAR